MSNELQRRLATLERRFGRTFECGHALPFAINPSEAQLAAMAETLADCPNCRELPLNALSLLVLRYPQRAETVDLITTAQAYN